MIVRMKKIAIITQSKDAQVALKAIRSLGVVHVQESQPPKSKDIASIHEDLALLDQALEVISEAEFASGCEGTLARRDIVDCKSACRHIIDSWKRLDQLEEFSHGLSLKVSEWERWGDFDPELIHEFSRKDIYVRLFRVPLKKAKDFPGHVVVKIIFTEDNIAYCATFSRKPFETAFEEVELPKMSLEHMRRRITENRRISESISDDLKNLFCYQPKLLEQKKSLEKELEFHAALSSMGQTGSLSYLSGFAPYYTEVALTGMAKKEGWGIFITDPAEDEEVPTFIRNPKWVSIIKPVFQMIQIVPGYRELDISPLFLIFLSFFFGMIIGDAGYGMIYFCLTFLAQYKWGKKAKDKSVFFLFYLFSFCAIIWGLLTGTVFGQEWYFARGFKALLPILNDAKFLQAFCFFLGAFHLTLAHSWQAALKFPSLKALADIGWICVLWAAFFMARLLILGDSFPPFGKWLIITGITLVIFFTAPQKNILKTLGGGLATVALSLMNNFTDVVSYIRLFAVGLAGVAIANTVNTLAGEAGDNIVAKVLIIFIGHTINIILGPMSVLVHGIRLNVLEFSGHANITWSGLAYKPLRE